MYIKEITIKNFRGFLEESTIEFGNGINILLGANNSGKTSILKALELLFSVKAPEILRQKILTAIQA